MPPHLYSENFRAFFGHFDTHTPHLMQSGSAKSSPFLYGSKFIGQTLAHNPQLTQASSTRIGFFPFDSSDARVPIGQKLHQVRGLNFNARKIPINVVMKITRKNTIPIASMLGQAFTICQVNKPIIKANTPYRNPGARAQPGIFRDGFIFAKTPSQRLPRGQ